MGCIFSRYIEGVDDVDSMFKFIRDSKIDSWKVRIGSRDFTKEEAVRAYVSDCIIKGFFPWAALFVG